MFTFDYTVTVKNDHGYAIPPDAIAALLRKANLNCEVTVSEPLISITSEVSIGQAS